MLDQQLATPERPVAEHTGWCGDTISHVRGAADIARATQHHDWQQSTRAAAAAPAFSAHTCATHQEGLDHGSVLLGAAAALHLVQGSGAAVHLLQQRVVVL
jgi:hypothetical protein